MFPENLKTLPDDDPLLQRVDSSDYLLRRYNPDNANECVTIDEGSIPRQRLTSGAITGFSQDGCSVNRSDVMTAVGIPIREMLLPKYRSVAEASAASLRDFSFVRSDGSEVQPFEVSADAYPDPSLEAPAARHQVAHALITIRVTLSKADKKIAVGTLARTIFNPLALA